MSKIAVTTIHFDRKYSDKDRSFTEIFQNQNEKIVSDLMYALEGFVVHVDIFRSKEEKLLKALNDSDFFTFYNTLQKIVKKAKKEFKGKGR